MENKKQILSMQLNVDDFAPASDSEKESLSVMRESVSFWKDGLRRLRKNPIAMVSLAVLIILRQRRKMLEKEAENRNIPGSNRQDGAPEMRVEDAQVEVSKMLSKPPMSSP